MTPLEFFAVLFLGWLIFKPKRPGIGARSRRVRTRRFKAPPGRAPVTPVPTYICENCGMTIHTGHGHTREECETYEEDPTKPDCRLQRTMKERPGSNDPRIRKPYYHEPGTFTNWGAGKEATT